MKDRVLLRLTQVALCGLARTAEELDANLRGAFEQVGIPPPEQTRGARFARAMRDYAARLEPHVQVRNASDRLRRR